MPLAAGGGEPAPDGMTPSTVPGGHIAVLGDSVTTDHISPAGAIKKDSPAGRYLIEHGVDVLNLTSKGSADNFVVVATVHVTVTPDGQ